MTDSISPSGPGTPTEPTASTEVPAGPPPSFVKLAMRNMVRKGRQSLLHFGLTAVGFSAVLLLLAWFGRPSLPQ
ncbi:DUF3285 domain-containing protein [Synechococcus sp. BA-124 BA4]|jgi:hypothetical protein|uniref:DUF3285 domain-containing protein n=1 Tax=unclassified Synechococcus TaxID=2626047 RepID=UPI0018CF61AC|nr:MULTISPECIES: DUF3285 domain-containing protein [unclassified Synechococcus]MEA5398960.1 DUF3285 domain-containing protein [Synechococcus sp. BA-124 BA4]QPN55578.1 DUF3285 domain-containing protein [Synechococcus sp. CBW1107]CAK6690605.1 hypothetical protein BBFGKLBO_00852 [Synechococcus sp. CBW1107]